MDIGTREKWEENYVEVMESQKKKNRELNSDVDVAWAARFTALEECVRDCAKNMFGS